MKLTIKEATIKSLEDLKELSNSTQVYEHILSNQYYDFGTSKTPASTISACLGDFIRNGDTRVKRIKLEGGIYSYYLTKYEQEIGVDILTAMVDTDEVKGKRGKKESYKERALHKLLSSYLNNTKVYSKTILHEKSKTTKDSNQTWTHPDMVGVKFLKLQTKVSQNFLNSVNRLDTFKLSSYELKKEINSDAELKKAYFQAVSNSSWANYGYLVAFEFSDSLLDEMERLNQSFGIGIIELNSNAYKSRVLFPSTYRELDFKTIDKLCKMNNQFEQFIEQCEKLLTADERYLKSTEKEFDEYCDECFVSDSEMERYCEKENIPNENESLSITPDMT